MNEAGAEATAEVRLKCQMAMTVRASGGDHEMEDGGGDGDDVDGDEDSHDAVCNIVTSILASSSSSKFLK